MTKPTTEPTNDSDRCVLNNCGRPRGSGTWCRIRGLDAAQPVCEEHWQAMRHIWPLAVVSR